MMHLLPNQFLLLPLTVWIFDSLGYRIAVLLDES